MTPEELAVAEVAIREPRDENYRTIHSQIYEETGIATNEVEIILQRLVKESILRVRPRPAHYMADGELSGQPAEDWYEKGDRWPD